jgi:hypothetical protein
MSAAGRCAAPDRKEAASPPLASGKKAAALWPGTRRARVRGRPSGVKPAAHRLRRRPCGPGLTPETTAAPQAGNTGRRQPAPPRSRRVR